MRLFRTMTQVILLMLSGWVMNGYAQEIVGRNERITILPEDIELNAKVDTGAVNSSLDARNIERFEKDGQEWVRFEVVRTLNNKKPTLEYPLKKNIRIISRTKNEYQGERPYQRRPVIDMRICLGGVAKIVEVNLTDRSNFIFPFLLGENSIAAFNLLVDVQKDYTLTEKCPTQ